MCFITFRRIETRCSETSEGSVDGGVGKDSRSKRACLHGKKLNQKKGKEMFRENDAFETS